jgi:Ring finger domain
LCERLSCEERDIVGPIIAAIGCGNGSTIVRAENFARASFRRATGQSAAATQGPTSSQTGPQIAHFAAIRESEPLATRMGFDAESIRIAGGRVGQSDGLPHHREYDDAAFDGNDVAHQLFIESTQCYQGPRTPEDVVSGLPQAAAPTDQPCTICFEEDVDIPFVSLPCRHVFHRPCVAQWLRSSTVCPLCRFDVAQAAEEQNTRRSRQRRPPTQSWLYVPLIADAAGRSNEIAPRAMQRVIRAVDEEIFHGASTALRPFVQRRSLNWSSNPAFGIYINARQQEEVMFEALSSEEHQAFTGCESNVPITLLVNTAAFLNAESDNEINPAQPMVASSPICGIDQVAAQRVGEQGADEDDDRNEARPDEDDDRNEARPDEDDDRNEARHM